MLSLCCDVISANLLLKHELQKEKKIENSFDHELNTALFSISAVLSVIRLDKARSETQKSLDNWNSLYTFSSENINFFALPFILSLIQLRFPFKVFDV